MIKPFHDSTGQSMKKFWYDAMASRHLGQAVEELRLLEKKLSTPTLRLSIPFIFRAKGHFKSMECMQNGEEIQKLYEEVVALNPQVVMEIGTAKGGALYLWLQAAHDHATVISIDLPGGEFGGGYPSCRRPFYQSFKKPRQTLHLLQADSHHPSTLQKVKQQIKTQPLDFLFIDGDHTYEGVKQDFEMYSPLVRPGGLIAFHDILPRPDIPDIQVDRFWHEIKGSYSTVEFIGSSGKGRPIGCGILRK